MKKSIVTFAAATALASTLSASHLTTAQSDLSVDEAVKKFEKAVASRNITVFDVIEHSKLADKVGLKMTDTTVVIVGSPKIGTLLMQCEPKIALELPLKFLRCGEQTKRSAGEPAKRYGEINLFSLSWQPAFARRASSDEQCAKKAKQI